MCEPVTVSLISGAMLAAGTGMKMMQNNALADANNKAQQEAVQRSNAARQAELTRQAGFQAQRNELFQQDSAQAGAENTTSRLGDAIAGREASYMSRVPAATGGGALDMPTYASSVVAGDAGRTLAGALSGARDRLRSRAALEGYGDVAQQNRMGLLSSATRLGTLGGLAQGSMSASKLETGIQPGTFTNDMGIGDILQTAGTAGLGSANRVAGWAGYTAPAKV